MKTDLFLPSTESSKAVKSILSNLGIFSAAATLLVSLKATAATFILIWKGWEACCSDITPSAL